MKRFFKTVPGKVILFVTCILSVCTICACIAGAVVFVETGFYEYGEDELVGEAVGNNIVNDWLDLYNNGVYEENEEGVREYKHDGNLILKVYDTFEGEDELIAETEGAEAFFGEGTGNSNTESLKLEYDVELYIPEGYYFTEWNYASVRSQYYSFNAFEMYPGSEQIMKTAQQKIKAAFKAGFPENDRYALICKWIHIGFSLRYMIYVIAGVAALLALICFIVLMCVSARRREDAELHPGPLHKVPFDLVLVFFGFAVIAYIMMLDEYFDRSMEGTIACAVVMPFVFSLFLGFCMGVAARIKDKSLLTNTVIWRLCKVTGRFAVWFWNGMKKLVVNLPMAWKGVALVAGDAVIDFILIVLAYEHNEEAALSLLVIKTLVLIGVAIYVAMKQKILKDGALQLAEGNLDLRIDTAGMLPEMRNHAENLNRIGEGMNIAVAQRLKSERMKAELITNVSHDIKTPLTSIINYTGLIANESCENDKHSQYSEVLLRQAERLKRLLEDLVEASKASTGNLDVDLAPCDASVFISQASGEYEEKLEAAQLSLVVKQPEESLRILADGRRMWRIFDNLMNNICKYSLPGSRVYLTLERFGDTARFVFKNTSKDVLDVSEDELMERFVRGDASRNTEGNGLGLSIAKSMAELQNGMLKIETDGDLFKAILMFPVIEG